MIVMSLEFVAAASLPQCIACMISLVVVQMCISCPLPFM